MRSATLAAAIAIAIFVVGCGPSAEECRARGTAALEAGTGDAGFTTIPADGILIQEGLQGGSHLWIGARGKGFSTDSIDVSYGVRDATDQTLLSQDGLETSVVIHQDADGTQSFWGLQGRLAVQESDVIGKDVILFVNVTDDCHKGAVVAEVKAHVTGVNGL